MSAATRYTIDKPRDELAGTVDPAIPAQTDVPQLEPGHLRWRINGCVELYGDHTNMITVSRRRSAAADAATGRVRPGQASHVMPFRCMAARTA